jgi:diamine N-acetyltransferase
MAKITNIIGERITLGPLERETAIALQLRSRNDFHTQRTTSKSAPQPTPLESVEHSYDQHGADDRTVRFLIAERSTGAPIGTTSLHRVDHWNGTAMFGINIAVAEARGRGYGTDATRLTLDYAFTALGLHNITLGVASFNPAAIRAYEKAGFRTYGCRHQCWRMGATRYDEILMECLATEFDSLVLKHILAPDAERRISPSPSPPEH